MHKSSQFSEFKKEFGNIVDQNKEIQLVDVVDKLNLLRDNQNDQDSQESLYNFLEKSNKNLIIKSEDYLQNENSQDICRNLFTFVCTILNYDPLDSNLPQFDEKLLNSYINNINYDRDDPDLIVIDQVIAMRSIINRPAFSLSRKQKELVLQKFNNMAENRSKCNLY